MSPFQKGIATAVGFVAGGAVAIAAALVGYSASFTLSDEALSDIAQIGATLLVAYAIETSWLVKESRARGSKRENWLGFVVGLGVCGVAGIAIAIALVGRHSSSFLAALGVTWMLFSLGLLALLVAALPYALYEWVHAIHTEYPDE
jgi:threonine/homoserine/homoserine lactone efflux protein